MMLLIGCNFFNSGGAVGHAIGRIYESKFKPTLLVESIDKIESPKNINGDFFLTKFSGLLGGRNARDFISVQLGWINTHGRGQIEFAADCFVPRRIEVRNKGDLADFDVYPIRPGIGWRLATIFEPKTELRRERETERVIAIGYWRYRLAIGVGRYVPIRI